MYYLYDEQSGYYFPQYDDETSYDNVDTSVTDDGSSGFADSGYGDQSTGIDWLSATESAFSNAFTGQQGIFTFAEEALPYIGTAASVIAPFL